MLGRYRLLAFVLVGVCAALPAFAEAYTIQLTNGTTFLTRYQPEDASWDADKLVFLDEAGNLVALAKGDVETISTESENRGFGHVLNSTTLAIGWAPNDALDPDSEEGKSASVTQQAEDAAAALAQPVYNQQQFVEPSAATGLPLSFIGAGNVTPPMGGSGAEPVQSPPPPPEQ
jgi:hypothetical protein